MEQVQSTQVEEEEASSSSSQASHFCRSQALGGGRGDVGGLICIWELVLLHLMHELSD